MSEEKRGYVKTSYFKPKKRKGWTVVVQFVTFYRSLALLVVNLSTSTKTGETEGEEIVRYKM